MRTLTQKTNTLSVKKNSVRKSYKVTSKAIMKPTQLRSKYLKLRTDEIKSISTRQPNFCVSLLGKAKKEFYTNQNVNGI